MTKQYSYLYADCQDLSEEMHLACTRW